jgi:hypothetical protein
MTLEIQWVRLRYWLLDSEISYADVNFWLDISQIGSDWSKVPTFGDALGDKLAQLSECELVDYDIILYYTQSVDFYALTNPLYNHGTFIFETTAGTRFIAQVPAFDLTKLDTDGVTILQTDTDITNFTAMIVSGDGTVAPSFGGDDMDALNAAYLQVRPISGEPVAG